MAEVANPPPVPPTFWIRSVERGPIQYMPYLVYVYGQLMWNSRGEIGYEWRADNNGDGFLLHLKITPTDVENCESLQDAEEIWIRLRTR